MGNFYSMLVSSVTYKKGSLVAFSIPTSFGIELLIREQSFFGISLGLCLLLCILIGIDFITGVTASKANNIQIESKLIARTFYKCLMIYLFFWILYEVTLELRGTANEKGVIVDFVYRYAESLLSYIRTLVFTLVILREWISIGENSFKIFKTKIYIFSIVEKLFEVIERKFINKVEEKMDEIDIDTEKQENK